MNKTEANRNKKNCDKPTNFIVLHPYMEITMNSKFIANLKDEYEKNNIYVSNDNMLKIKQFPQKNIPMFIENVWFISIEDFCGKSIDRSKSAQNITFVVYKACN